MSRLMRSKVLSFFQSSKFANSAQKMDTGKRLKRPSRRKKSALEDGATEAAVQTDPVNGSCASGPQTGGSHRRQEGSAGDPRAGRVRGHSDEPSSTGDTSQQGAGRGRGRCDDKPTLVVPGRIVQNVYPVRFQGTVLYIPTGGFLQPHGLLDKMRGEE